MRYMNAIATPKSAPDADLGAFTKEFRSRTGSRRVGKLDRFSHPSNPKLITFKRTYGIGIHRFDMDANYAYISTEMEGYLGNILLIYDIRKRIDGRQIAIDEEDHAHAPEEMAKRRGRPHASLWPFDITDPAKMQPLAVFEVSEVESPWNRATPGRFGAHQFQEHMKGGDTLAYCAWFAGGLRIVDVADPSSPREAGWFIPEPTAGKVAPQSNDVDVDERGLVYLADRYKGFDILEFNHA